MSVPYPEAPIPRRPLPDDVRDFLAKPNPAVIATVGRDGQPVSVATWYLMEGDGRILVNMDSSRARLEHLRRDPRVSLTVLDEDWYTHVSVQGTVSEMADDPDLADIDRLARHYTGRRYGNRSRPRVSAWIEPERWHGWGKARR